jgi:hypothetical protein
LDELTDDPVLAQELLRWVFGCSAPDLYKAFVLRIATAVADDPVDLTSAYAEIAQHVRPDSAQSDGRLPHSPRITQSHDSGGHGTSHNDDIGIASRKPSVSTCKGKVALQRLQ